MNLSQSGWRKARRFAFFAAVLALLILIQTDVPVLLLKNLLSQDQADQLAETVRAATPGLLVALVVTYLYERSKDSAYERSQEEVASRFTDTVRELLHQDEVDGLERLAETTSPQLLVEAGMQRLYGRNGASLDNLVETLLPTRGLLRDVDVSFTLRDNGTETDTFTLDVYYRAMAFDLPEFLVAYAVGTETASLMCTDCPQLTNVFSFDDGDGVESAAVKALNDPESFRFMVEVEPGRFGNIINGSLARLPLTEYERFNVPQTGPGGSPIVVLHMTIPDGGDRNVVYMTKTSGASAPLTRFVYYFEDRPAYVRRVTFDWSGLRHSNDPDATRHIVPFFVPRGAAPTVDPVARRVDVTVEQWILPGGGALLVW